ncbi:MAG: methyltransferase type 11, partial [Gammaproteobacteria bacterium]|nr:methyltransferase type 11 [Gammaproteobacteria bacterium]
MTTPRRLKSLYEQGKNITELLREERGLQHNTDEIIEIAYDLQTGSYISAMNNPAMQEHKKNYSSEIATTISSLCTPTSILEAGIGEATTFSGVLQNLGTSVSSYGFDLSWSRVAYAKHWLQKQNIS